MKSPCPMHETLQQQIAELSRQLHDTKITILRALIAGIGALGTVITAGLVF